MDGWKLVPVDVLKNLLHCGDTDTFITPYVTARIREILNEDTVPPTGEVEIIAWVDTDGDFYKERCYPNMKAVILLSDHRVRVAGLQAENAALKHIDAPVVVGSLPKRKEVWPQDMVGWAAAGAWNSCYDAFMPIVTRLTAENARLQAEVRTLDNSLDDVGLSFDEVCKERDALKAEVEQYQTILRTLVEEATCADWSCEDTDSVFHAAQTWCGKFHHMKSRLTQATAIIDYVDQHIELDAILAADIPAFQEGASPVLTAEVEFLMKRASELKTERDAVQSELTKARELLIEVKAKCYFFSGEFMLRLEEVLGNQSAPAAKDGE